MAATKVERRTFRAQVARRGPWLFATPADEPRARRASDVVLLVGDAFGLALTSLAAVRSPGFARAVAQFLAAFPHFLDGAWQFFTDLLALFALLLAVATVVSRRWSMTRDVLLAGATAAVVWLVVARLTEGSWPALWGSMADIAPPPWYPSPRLALPAAVVITLAPHLTRPLRRCGYWLIALGMFSLAALGATTPLGAVAGVLVSATAAAAVHLVFGSCGGRPSLQLVRAALDELGVQTSSLGATDRQQAGLFVLNGTDDQGDALVVKLYGRDAADTALVSTLGRAIWYRGPGSPLRLGRLHQVDHEAFLTLFAGQSGVLTDRVVTAGLTASADALLVLRRSGRLLADAIDRGQDPRVVTGIWALLRRLHGASVAHGQVDDHHLLVHRGQLGMADFRGAAVAASSSQLRTDEAQALVTVAALAGEQQAVASALEALGPDGLASVLPYLQPASLTPELRQRLRLGEVDLEQLRRRAAEAAGTEAPALVQLRRVTVGSAVRVLLPAAAVLAVISKFAGLDLAELANDLEHATWWLVGLSFALAQLPRLTQAVSTLGAAPEPLPLGPAYALQLTMSYLTLALPSSAGRVAVGIRFHQRHGVPPGAAVGASALDTLAGHFVQAVLVAVLVLFTPASLALGPGAPTVNALPILLVVVVVSVGAIGVVALVSPWRHFVLGWAQRLGSEARGALHGLLTFRRLGLLLSGNLASEVLFALALAGFTRALGPSVGLGEALLISSSVSLLTALVPVPGGIGVVEGGLTFGLTQAGVPEQVALVAVLLYRLSTLYLPPVWGYFALRWLERNGQL